MTTESQKQAEEHYVTMLLDGFIEYTSLGASEKPDFWVRRSTPPDIGLEVTEYHPSVQGVRRAEVESRWWKGGACP
jgi:hypothetical protein